MTVDPIRRLVPILVLLLLVLAPAAADELYQWTDDEGVVRYTAHRERLPRAALSRAVRIRRDPATGVVSTQPLGAGPLVAAQPDPSLLEVAAARQPESSLPDVAAAPPGREPAAQPAATAASSPPASVARESWAIQLDVRPVSPWLRPLDALGLLEGHRLYRVTRQVEGQAWQRLRLGFFATPGEAQSALARVERHFPGAWIDRVDAAELAASEAQRIERPGRADVTRERSWRHGEQGYAVQLLASPADDRLRALTRLELLGRHQLFRSTVEEDGEIWERLALGFFPSADAAEAVRRQLVETYPEARVERARPPELRGSEELALAP
ncbi:MAG: hypothetical protein QNK04_30440 [Myxococcota bacterium]|nr:hypothetical protein [Myxococcota bacterium]